MTVKPNQRAKKAIGQGRHAASSGQPSSANPYTRLGSRFTALAAWWSKGWHEIHGGNHGQG